MFASVVQRTIARPSSRLAPRMVGMGSSKAFSFSGFRRVPTGADGSGISHVTVESEACKNVKMQEEGDSHKMVHSLRGATQGNKVKEQQDPLTRISRPPFASLPALHMR